MASASNTTPQSGNLPLPLSTFVGRKDEIRQVRQLLAAHRLLTLTGPGGAGKTRLALRVGRKLQADYKDGVWLVEFASLTAAELVPQAVAAALGLREEAGQQPAAALTTHLQARSALLVLDNCEHLVEACARIAVSLLASCPELRLLATSREPLGVPGEALWMVPPLSLPAPQPWRTPAGATESLAAYRQSEALQLFVARAETAFPGFQLTAGNGPWVAQICRRLDGIPLAIELAAARVRTFSVRQIAERLDDRFQLLSSGARTAPVRHQALEATLDWSYALLTAAARTVFERLSVFAGGWTLAAAEAICAGEGLAAAEVPQFLAELVDKSLVMVEVTPGRRRYRLLETIRQYARQQLAESGETAAVWDRHLAYYADWAERAAPHLRGQEQPALLEHFAAEHDNLRAALAWSQKAEERTEAGLRLAAACGHYWRLRGYLGEGRQHLTALLSLPGAQARTRARAWALLWAANLAYLQSDYAATRSLAEEGLAISRELGARGRTGVARALDLLGELATEVGDYEAAPALFEEALAIYRELDETRGIADMLLQLGWAAMRTGAYREADLLLNESLPLLTALDESALLGLVLAGLGELAIRQGNLEQAEERLEESLSLRRELGDRWGIATALGSLGWVALLRRDFERMRALLGESLALRQEIGDRGGCAWCLEKLAEALTVEAQALPAAHRQRALVQAARIFGAADALRAPLDSVVDPADQAAYERTVAAVREAVGEGPFSAAWDEGSKWSLARMIEEALAPALPPDVAATLSGAEAERVKYGGLSPRERQTAALIARGKANREIAEMMVVQVKTIETYVTRILNKLGFDSRVQIATWALEVGLLEEAADD